MKLVGHSEEQTDINLVEVIFTLEPDEARKFAEFLLHAADDMESMGSDYDHEHLSDFDKEFESSPHVIVVRK